MDLHDLLAQVASGTLPIEAAVAQLGHPGELWAKDAVLDTDRRERTGIPEVVFGEGKTPEQLIGILTSLLQSDLPVLATRVDEDKARVVLQTLTQLDWDHTARTLTAGEPPPATLGRVGVLCAGTSDMPVASEAALTARWLGCETEVIADVGVAGLHRLLSRLEHIRTFDVLIVVAGMEGALPAVVTGQVKAPVIAVPTSVGYGVHLGGLTALFGMLDACASGMTVVNIDNGFGAAVAARRMLGVR